MRLLKRILLISAVILILIQFIPNKLPGFDKDTKDDIITNSNTNAELATILKTSCYDCHSNQTHYPWYAHVAPVSWLLHSDVEEGRRHLNFSRWNLYETKRKIKKLGDIKEEVEKGDMPMPIYTFIHRGTKLSEVQKEQVMKWADEMSNQLMH